MTSTNLSTVAVNIRKKQFVFSDKRRKDLLENHYILFRFIVGIFLHNFPKNAKNQFFELFFIIERHYKSLN